jgi:hypothetical protein
MMARLLPRAVCHSSLQLGNSLESILLKPGHKLQLLRLLFLVLFLDSINTPLESFGETPFDIVHKRNKLFTRSNDDIPTTSSIHNNSATEDTTIVDLDLQEFLHQSSDVDSIETS